MERLTIMTEKGAALNVTATTEEAARKQVHDMFLQVLAAFYEIEEQQEQGCDFCNNKKRKASPFEDASLELHENRLVIWEDLNCLGSYIVSYCPVCGKRLVE